MDEQGVGPRAYPRCRRCGEGELVPLSDFGAQAAEVRYKAWVCTNPACGFNVKIRSGEIIRGGPIVDASKGGRRGGGRGRPRPMGLVRFPGTDGIGRGGPAGA